MRSKVLLSQKIAPIIVFLVFLSLTGYSIYLITELFFVRGSLFAFFIVPSIIILLVMLIITAVFGNAILTLYSMELIFHPNALEQKSKTLFRKFKNSIFAPFLIEYANIEKIKQRKEMAAWEITDRSGKTVFLAPNLFEKKGGEALLGELRSRLPESTFENDLKPILYKATKTDKIKTGILFLSILFGSFLMLMDSNVIFLRSALLNAWNIEKVFAPFERGKDSFSDGTDGIWLITERGDISYLQYWNEAGSQQHIELPSLSYKEPGWVSTNEAGTPVIWLKNRVLTLTKNGWQSVPYAHNLQIDFFYSRQYFYAYKEEAWAIVNGEDK